MIRRLLWLYPRRWRDRYGDELVDLVESVGLSPSTAFDLVANAMGERMRPTTRRTAGGPSMTPDRPGWGSTALAIVGFIVLVPTLLFISFSVLIYNIGVPVDTIRSIIEVAISIAPVDVGFAVLPFVALAAAAAPLVQISLEGDRGRREVVARVTLRSLRTRLANVVVAALAMAVITVLVIYQVTERLL
jgi:hypothetical protein